MSKHYVTVDDRKRVLRGFSDFFEQPGDSAICINEDAGVHFELNGGINPPILDVFGVPLYRFDGEQVVARTQEELDADRPVVEPAQTFEERLAAVEELVKGTPSYGELLEAVNVLLGDTP